MRRKWLWLAGSVSIAIAAVAAWLVVMPPELLRVGDGYAAKIVCSNVFVAGRDPQVVLADDVQAPGHPLLRLVRISVDETRKTVTARMFGFAAPGHAIYREGLGCTNVTQGEFAAFPGNRQLRRRAQQVDDSKPWPDGSGTAINPAVQTLVMDKQLAGPGMRAILVIKNGRILAETYADGFSSTTPLLGWSMTKSVTAALIGIRVRDGEMALDRTELLPQWRNDPRHQITLADLMAMQSGLQFNEDYGDVTDVTRMLYLEGDMADFAADKSLEAKPGERFNYSSGTTTILSRLWMDTFGSVREALTFPRAALFRPLGMTSAVLEPDAHGTFVGSSYMYATARDWGRFGLFLLQNGNWNGEQLLPEGFVDFMRTPTKASEGRYGAGQVWTKYGSDGGPALPPDAYWMQGHDGQTVMLVPSLGLAVVRLGLTPSRSGYDVRMLEAKIIEAVK
ncbi:MAG TPA: serine hydrolase [Pararhizobium sp.]|uniref:serine hydrolase domain-containing protein n=1 Tax=Pararhizobium sp. TaxID=1977563 RepID=UPI002B64B8FF|nr:serine hydrolase [Pararhizobium sp.]HTO31826.1 serine hydrolase [Pararhizobium sp.]